MARGSTAAKDAPAKQGRLSQIRQAYTITKQADPRIGLLLAGCVLGAVLVFVLVGLLLHHPVYLGILGLMTGIFVATIVFGRRAERAAYRRIEGQPGAAAAALQSLRKGWTVQPGVAVNRNQDLVHRAVGRPGIVLVGEGAPGRVGALIAQERKKLSRVAPDVPVYDFQAGDGEGQVPLRRVQREVLKLPRNLKPAEIGEVLRRLKSLGTVTIPLPKGPMPKGSKVPRPPKGAR